MRDRPFLYADRSRLYEMHRPAYPPEVLGLLTSEIGFSPASVIADIGSGTGILTRLLLANGNRVFGVEPSGAMRREAERVLARQSRFVSVCGTAESTTLPAGSVDVITAGQAFHWFDPEVSRREFARILIPSGHVVLLWNVRCRSGSAFLVALESLYTRAISGYGEVAGHDARLPARLRALFGGDDAYGKRSLSHEQRLGVDALVGLTFSTSFAPRRSCAAAASLERALRTLHAEHVEAGVVTIKYDTWVYFGPLVT